MNKDNKYSLINLYKQRVKNFELIMRANDLNHKKTFLKSKTNFISTPLNFPELDEKVLENSKISINENNDKMSHIILPSISNTTLNNKISLNSSMNNLFHSNKSLISPKKKYVVKLKRIKIKNPIENNEFSTPVKQNQSLINLYNENLFLKQRFERYKIKKAENIGNFSYKKYNYKLMKYSSIDLSQDSVKAFKKNMKTIEENMNGQTIKRKNRWLLFLDKIGNFAPEGLKKKLKSLSEKKYQKAEDNKDNSKKNVF